MANSARPTPATPGKPVPKRIILGWHDDADVHYPSLLIVAAGAFVVLIAIFLRVFGVIGGMGLMVLLTAGLIVAVLGRSRFHWERKVILYCQEESVVFDPPRLALVVTREKEWEIDLRVVNAIREQIRTFDALPNAKGRHLVFELTNGVEVALLIEAPIIGMHPGYSMLRRSLAELGLKLA